MRKAMVTSYGLPSQSDAKPSYSNFQNLSDSFSSGKVLLSQMFAVN